MVTMIEALDIFVLVAVEVPNLHRHLLKMIITAKQAVGIVTQHFKNSIRLIRYGMVKVAVAVKLVVVSLPSYRGSIKLLDMQLWIPLR